MKIACNFSGGKSVMARISGWTIPSFAATLIVFCTSVVVSAGGGRS